MMCSSAGRAYHSAQSRLATVDSEGAKWQTFSYMRVHSGCPSRSAKLQGDVLEQITRMERFVAVW